MCACVLGLFEKELTETHICLISLNVLLKTIEGWEVISSQSLISGYRELEMHWHSHSFVLFWLCFMFQKQILYVLLLLELDAL